MLQPSIWWESLSAPHHLFVFNRQSWIRWNSYHYSSNDVLCTKITSQTRSPTITSLIWDTFFSNKQTKLLEIDPVVLEKKIFFKCHQCIFTIFLLSFLRKCLKPSIWTNLKPFTQGCVVPKISPVVLEKKIFKCHPFFIWNNLNSLSLRIFCAKFGSK